MPTPRRATSGDPEGSPYDAGSHRGERGRWGGRGRLPYRRQAGGEGPHRHRERRGMRAAAPQGQGVDAAPCRADVERARRGHGARVGRAGHHRDQEQVRRRARGARAAVARGRSHPAAQRHLPGRRRVPAGPRRHWSRHPARRPAEGRRRGGGQRRDAGQHRPRPSRDPQVPDGRRRGPNARHVARTSGDSDRRPDRGGRRGDGRRHRRAARRRHDGTPGRRPR